MKTVSESRPIAEQLFANTEGIEVGVGYDGQLCLKIKCANEDAREHAADKMEESGITCPWLLVIA